MDFVLFLYFRNTEYLTVSTFKQYEIMEEILMDSSSDDDTYTNSVARLRGYHLYNIDYLHV